MRISEQHRISERHPISERHGVSVPCLSFLRHAYAVPLTLVAGLGHASLGTVDWQLLGLLLCGSLPGIWLGSHFVTRVSERFIRSALSVLLAWAGSKLVFI